MNGLIASAVLLSLLSIQATCASSGHSVLLTWKQQPQPTNVVIAQQRMHRAASCAQSQQVVVAVGPAASTVTDTTVQIKQQYAYWMTVVDQNGVESPKSNCVTASIP